MPCPRCSDMRSGGGGGGKKEAKSRSLSCTIKLGEIGQAPFFIYYCHHLWPSNEASCWSTMHITHQCLIKHIGSPLPTNWLLNFPHGRNIKTPSPAPLCPFPSPSPSVSRAHFVIGSTFDPRSKGRGCELQTLLIWSSLTLLAAALVGGTLQVECLMTYAAPLHRFSQPLPARPLRYLQL